MFPIDLKGKHKGLGGLYLLFQELTANQKFDCVIDLHNVIRSRFISTLFRLKGVPIYRINKARKEKKAFLDGSRREKLAHTTKRYQEVFQNAGFVFPFKKVLLAKFEISEKLARIISPHSKINIGIAPFAAYKSKEWGLEKTHELIKKINSMNQVQFYLFGGGSDEVEKLGSLANSYDNVTNLSGQFTLKEEIYLLRKLSIFIGMDSGNSHIAALVGVPVISLWGGTHPDLGFNPLYQPEDNCIQLSESEQKECKLTVYGTSKPQLKQSPFFCIKKIRVEQLIDRLIAIKVLP